MSAIFLTIAGAYTFYTIPKESNPDVKMPVINVIIEMPGISSEGAERLILRPMEKKLKGVQYIKKIYGRAGNGYGRVSIEFEAGFDSDKALKNVKDKIDEAKNEMPSGIKEPVIREMDYSKFPVLSVALFGEISEKDLIWTARLLKKKIEMIPNILEVDIIGDRKDQVDIILNPNIFEKYKISQSQLGSIVNLNNQLLSAGFLTFDNAASSVDSNSIFKSIEDIEEAPVISSGNNVLKIKDLGRVEKTFRDPLNLAFVGSRPAVIIDISKRYGANTIDTINKVKALIESEKGDLISDSIHIEYSRDSSKEITESLSDLVNNVIFAIILVVAIVISQIGFKQGILVGMSIPISFFIGVLCIHLLGYTLNMIVLFALILSSGMIVDASTIVVEYADKLLAKGVHYKKAYIEASGRMAIPVLSSTITIIVVYFPLLLWPGVMGQFMKYIPITVILVLTASIVSALVFIPVFGYLFGKKTKADEARHIKDGKFAVLSEQGDVLAIPNFTGKYIKTLNKVIDHPKKIIGLSIIVLILSFILFKFCGKGIVFFPKVDTPNIRVVAHSSGNFNIEEKKKIMQEIAERVYFVKSEVKTYFIKMFGNAGPQNNLYSDDTVGIIEIELIDWNKRRKSDEVAESIRQSLIGYSGSSIEVLTDSGGPNSGSKDIEVQLGSEDIEKLKHAFEKVFEYMQKMEGMKDVTTTKAFPVYKIDLNFDKVKAAKYKINTQSFGHFIKMCTNGAMISQFRPSYSDDGVDIMLKLPASYCEIDSISELVIYTEEQKAVKISSFANPKLTQEISIIKKINGNITFRILANAEKEYNVTEQSKLLSAWIKSQNFDKEIMVKFSGNLEDQDETGSFLLKAFIVAIFIKVAILIGQFNSVYYGLITMSAIILSVMGVMFGLVITQNSFGIVMGGIGIIALAGVVVSNNIILIDTYQRFIKSGMEIRSAILRTCAQRFRPILMTSCTTVMGLIPMMFNFSIDFLDFKFVYNSPAGAWWEQLSTTIGGGLTFATICTLFLTPCCLILYTPEIHSKKEDFLDEIKTGIENK